MLSMNDASPAPAGTFSIGRVLVVLAPVAALLFGGLTYFGSRIQKEAREEMQSDMLSCLLIDSAGKPRTSRPFVDADGDLVSDFPPDDACVSPAVIRFSYIASPEPNDDATIWSGVVKAISDATGRPVEFVTYESTEEQLSALAAGELHVTGLNTGATPTAVAKCGFVPICGFGRADGSSAVTMKIIARVDGRIRELADLMHASGGQKPKVMFTTPSSNSGFKAALVLLLGMGLLPERDYDWGFSLGHDESILAIAGKEADIAPVSSDLLEMMVAGGDVRTAEIITIYESEKFPTAALGFVCNLDRDLREAISRTLLGFEWKGTELAKAYGDAGNVKFVPVNYKDDWANIRRIDEAVKDRRFKMR